jgi:hypothetical protein
MSILDSAVWLSLEGPSSDGLSSSRIGDLSEPPCFCVLSGGSGSGGSSRDVSDLSTAGVAVCLVLGGM